MIFSRAAIMELLIEFAMIVVIILFGLTAM